MTARFFRRGKTRKSIFLISGALACLIAFVLFGLPRITAPRLSQDQKQWREFRGDDPRGYPLEVLSHGFRMIQASRGEAKKTQKSPPRSAALVEWEWRVVIRNKSSRDEQVYVQYLLVDRDRLAVDVDDRISPDPVAAWETVTVQHRTEMVYDDLPRVADGVWEISWGESRKKRKGF